jgi:hypothetical protein
VVRDVEGGALISVHVKPRAARDAVVPAPFADDGPLVVQVTAPPVEGAANAAACSVVAKALGIPKSRVAVQRGASARHKTLFVEGLCAADVRARLRED